MLHYLAFIFLFFSACTRDVDFSHVTVDRCFKYFQDVHSFQGKEIQELEKYIEAIKEHIRAEEEALSYKKEALEALKDGDNVQFSQNVEKSKEAIKDMNLYWDRVLRVYQDATRAHEEYIKANEVVTTEKCLGVLKKKDYPEEALQALNTIEELNSEVNLAREKAEEAGDEGTEATQKEMQGLTDYTQAVQASDREKAIQAYSSYVEAFEEAHVPADKKLLSANEDLIAAKKEKQKYLKEFLDIMEEHKQ